MKNYLIIISLLLLQNAFGYKITHYEHHPAYGYFPADSAHFEIPSAFRSHKPYNFRTPYIIDPQTNAYAYRRIAGNPFRPQIFGNLNPKKIKNTGLFRNGGSLTGYSLPINGSDIYKQMGITPFDPKSKQKYGSVNCAQELFSSPVGSETYYTNGERIKDLGGISTKTGVTIIYD